jgi:hypothetical protein
MQHYHSILASAWKHALILIMNFGALIGLGSAQVVINEVMAYNRNAVGHAGSFPDYLELYNVGSTTVDLGGMSVDDGGTPPANLFVLPAGTAIQPKSYLLIWCSTNAAVSGLRAPFALSSDGETVRIRSASSLVMDEVKFGIQAADYCLGRVPDGTGAWQLVPPSPLDANQAQPLGSPVELRINEWLADSPSGVPDWLEVYNGSALPVMLSGLYLTDSFSGYFTNRSIASRSFIANQDFALFLADDMGGGSKTGAEHLDFKLGKSGEIISLYGSNRVEVLDQVTFGPQAFNQSEGRVPDGGSPIVRFPTLAQTPGKPNYAEIKGVLISEVLSHTDPPLEDAIELFNPGSNTVDISHWWLSDSLSNPKKYRIASGTIIPAGGYAVFYEYLFGAAVLGANAFQLDSVDGDMVCLSAGNADGLLTGEQTLIRFGPSINGRSFGRYPTPVGVDFVPMANRTFGVDTPGNLSQFRSGVGLSNSLPRVGPVVISEIMYAPAAGAEEYLELHNVTTATAQLYYSGYPTNSWRIRGGVEFDFPHNFSLAAGATVLLVGFDPAVETNRVHAFRATYGVPTTTLLLGPFVGRLNDIGEELHLQEPDKPEPPESSRPGYVPYCMVESIKYASSGLWPSGANDTGKSIHRIQAAAYGNNPTNWAAAMPLPGSVLLPGLDSDGDGLPDHWEIAHCFNAQDAGDAGRDADGDGVTNLAEYWAGTNPVDGNSVFRISHLCGGWQNLTMQFLTVVGRSYVIENTASLTNAIWQTVTNLGLVTISATQEIRLSPGINAKGFFRIKLTPQ